MLLRLLVCVWKVPKRKNESSFICVLLTCPFTSFPLLLYSSEFILPGDMGLVGIENPILITAIIIAFYGRR